MSAVRQARRLIGTFGAAQAGAAAVEFALVLPIMLLIYIGSVEASAMITMDRKVQTISGTVGDLVARSDTEITVATLQDYINAASGIMITSSNEPLDIEQIVTQVRVSDDGASALVDWSRGYEQQKAVSTLNHDSNQPFTLPAEIRAISKGQYVIVAETTYHYKPLYGLMSDPEIELYRQNFYLPRFGGKIALKP